MTTIQELALSLMHCEGSDRIPVANCLLDALLESGHEVPDDPVLVVVPSLGISIDVVDIHLLGYLNCLKVAHHLENYAIRWISRGSISENWRMVWEIRFTLSESIA